MQISLAQAAQRLLAAERILVLSHHFPDGDTLGSASALCRALQQKGKQVCFRCSHEVSDKFMPLFAGLESVFYEQQPQFLPDLIVSVDVADASLLGVIGEEYADRIDLSIDHHGTNRLFAKETFVDAGAAATAEIIARLFPLLGAALDAAAASCLFTGITTDTGCFRYRNTTSDSFRIAADMIDAGADAADINFRMFEVKSRARLEMERLVLDSASFFCDGKAVLMAVLRDMIERTEVREEDLDGISAIPRRVEGVLVGVTMRERRDGSFKVSVRTNGEVRACDICARLGGGGHAGAAGCTVEGPFEQACAVLRETVTAYLRENGYAV